jgi:hypothetical protein
MEWDYNTNQTSDNFSVHPGTGAVGVNSDGWLNYTDNLLAPTGRETARAVEQQPPPTGNIPKSGSDTAHAAEGSSIRATLAKGDTAHAAEFGQVTGGTTPHGADTARAAESALVTPQGTGGVSFAVKLAGSADTTQVGHGSIPPGLPGGAGGPAGPPAPYPGTGWEVKVLAAPDFHTLLAVIPSKVLLTLQFAVQLKDLGSGTVTLDMDDSFWTSVTLPNGQPAHYLLDFEHVWQVWQDGVCRHEFLGETVTEQLADGSEQRIATVTGPGTAATLKWGICAPPGFPGNIRYKLDAITDSFSETDVNGNLVLDTGLWNATANTGHISLNPSGTARLMASPGTTILGTTAYDATNTLVSAQVNPIVSPDANGNNLNGSQVTQMYIQSLSNPNYYALFGMSATSFYAQLRGPSGTFTQIIASATAFATAQAGNQDYQYWQIAESGGQGGGSGTFTFYTSSDGQNWKQQYSIRHNWDATNCGLYFAAAYSTDNAQFATVTGINSNVTTSSLAGPSYYTKPIIGGVWLDLLNQAKARGTVPFITTGQLSASTDSFGNPWTDSQSVQIANGTDLFTLLGAHAAMINADWIMQPGFRLQVGIPEPGKITLGTDRSGTIIFRDGMDSMARTRTRARDQVSNVLGVINSDGRTITATDSASVTSYGQREAWLQAAMQVTPADLEAVATAADLENATEVLSWTLQVAPYAAGRTIFKDFGVGDWVGLERPDFSAVDDVRVVAIAVQVNADGSETHELTLNSYIQWLQEQLAYIQTKLGGGFINAAGTTAIPSSITSQNTPSVFSLTLGSLGDVTSGGPGGNAPLVYDPVTGQWVPAGSDNTITGSVPLSIGGDGGQVTIAGDGSAVTVSAPPSPPADTGAPAPTPAKTTINITTTQITDATGVTRTIIGAQPDGTFTTVDMNGSAPAAPDSPSVAAGPQSLVIGWDGLLGGANPLSDFLWTEVHVSTVSGFTPSAATLEGTMAAGGHSIVVGNLSAGTTYFCKLMARNTSGVAGNPSGQVSGVPVSVGSGVNVTFQATAPASPNVGDLWGDTAAGNQVYQWNGTSWVLYQWGPQAISFTARGIGANTVTIANTAPSSPITGDLWYDGTNGYKLNQWSGSAWTPFQYGTNAIAAGSITAALIAAGTITATQIAAGTILGSNIAAATIAASNIVAGTITSGQIASGTITASNIAASTITGAKIAASTITGANIAAGTITASNIAGGTITASLLAANIVVAGIVNGTTIQAALFLATGSSGQVLAYSGTPAAGNLLNAIAGAAGSDSFGNSWPEGLYSQQLTLNDLASTPPAFAGASVFFSSVAGRPRYLSSAGANAVLERSEVNVAQWTVGNATTPGVISAPLNYLAGEGNQSSEYELEIDGIATTANTGQTAQTLTFQLGVDGSPPSGAGPVTFGAVMLAVGNTGFAYVLRFRLNIVTSGTSGTANIAVDGAMSKRSANAGSQTNPVISAPVNEVGFGKAFDTTVAHTLQVYAFWGGLSTGQSLTTYRTRVARRM